MRCLFVPYLRIFCQSKHKTKEGSNSAMFYVTRTIQKCDIVWEMFVTFFLNLCLILAKNGFIAGFTLVVYFCTFALLILNNLFLF